MDFSREVFWVQCHNLPIGCMNEKISNTLRVVDACDVEEDGFGLRKVRCLCIEMDLHKPLSQERTINIQGNWRWMPITYEKLPKLCFRRGRITHGRGDCGGAKGITESTTGQYSPWLRAKVGQEHDRGKQNHRPSPSNSMDNIESSDMKQSASIPSSRAAKQMLNGLGGKSKKTLAKTGEAQVSFSS